MKNIDELKKEIKNLEEKQDNCTITKDEEKKLKYLIWKYTNLLPKGGKI